MPKDNDEGQDAWQGEVNALVDLVGELLSRSLRERPVTREELHDVVDRLRVVERTRTSVYLYIMDAAAKDRIAALTGRIERLELRDLKA